MTQNTDAIFDAALSLPAEIRADLAERLLESLEEQDQCELDAAWAKEAESRIQAYRQGKLKAIPGDWKDRL